MVHHVLSPPKAAGLLALLVAATACGAPDATGPTPTFPLTATSSPQLSTPPVPSNNTITVKPTTPVEPTVEATTEPSPPPSETPPPAPPQPPPGEPTAPPPTEEPSGGPFVLQGTACPFEGAIAVNRRFKPMVCTAEGDKLRWQPA